jgi:hypothetical protein
MPDNFFSRRPRISAKRIAAIRNKIAGIIFFMAIVLYQNIVNSFGAFPDYHLQGRPNDFMAACATK